LLGRIYRRLADGRVAASIHAQLDALQRGGTAGSDRYFDPELALVVAAEESRAGNVFHTRGSLTDGRDTFTDGGCDDCGELAGERGARYLPSGYTRGWERLSYPSAEAADNREIHPLTNVPYTSLLTVYGAHLRHLREAIVMPALRELESVEGLNAAAIFGEDDQRSIDTRRLLTRAAFSGPGHAREILGHLREIAEAHDVELRDVVGDDALRQELLDAIPITSRDNLHSKPVRRALVAMVEARHIESAGVLRR
jgi:hypothetical protein